MSNTKIEWCDATWNVSVGCSAVSEGCKNCYARRMHKRLLAMGQDKYSDPFDVVKLDQKSLYIPVKWKAPKRIFVNSMSDLFHEKLSHYRRAMVFIAMSEAPQHEYLVLTKRPEVALEFYAEMQKEYEKALKFEQSPMVKNSDGSHAYKTVLDMFRKIWLGVSVENQATADERIPLLLQIPAAVRFVSAEPLLGPVDFSKVIMPDGDSLGESLFNHGEGRGIDWIIVGGETGPGARPMNPDWARSLKSQCRQPFYPFFFKSWGKYVPIDTVDSVNLEHDEYGYWEDDGSYISQVARADGVVKVGRSKSGNKLDGQEWKQFPREHPVERAISDKRGMMNEGKAND